MKVSHRLAAILAGAAAVTGILTGAFASVNNNTTAAPANATTTATFNQTSAAHASTFMGSNGKQFQVDMAAKVYGPDDARPPNRPAPPGYHWHPGHGIAGKGSGMQWIPAWLEPN